MIRFRIDDGFDPVLVRFVQGGLGEAHLIDLGEMLTAELLDFHVPPCRLTAAGAGLCRGGSECRNRGTKSATAAGRRDSSKRRFANGKPVMPDSLKMSSEHRFAGAIRSARTDANLVSLWHERRPCA
jgi:hypothetical protein